MFPAHRGQKSAMLRGNWSSVNVQAGLSADACRPTGVTCADKDYQISLSLAHVPSRVQVKSLSIILGTNSYVRLLNYPVQGKV